MKAPSLPLDARQIFVCSFIQQEARTLVEGGDSYSARARYHKGVRLVGEIDGIQEKVPL
jgi:hypothetical protein